MIKIHLFKNNRLKFRNKDGGFTLLEIVVSLTIFSLILLAVVSFLFSMNDSNARANAGREVLENAKNALDEITYEIRSAKSVYTPTTSAIQLSLETSKYVKNWEENTYIDFFLCGTAVCLKKEFQDPIALTSGSVEVINLAFTQVLTGTSPSVKVSLTLKYLSPGNNYAPITLTSSASLRSY